MPNDAPGAILLTSSAVPNEWRSACGWPAVTPVRRRSAPLGTGLAADGSRIARNSNSPEIAAIRRLTVAAAYPVLRPSRIEYTFPPGRPRNVAVRQCARYRGSVPVVAASSVTSLASSQRQIASRSPAYARTVRGEYRRSAT